MSTPKPSQSLPAAVDLEKSLLSCIMQAPDSMALVRVPIAAEDFFVEIHGYLWELILREAQSGRPTDVVSIAQIIYDRGHMDKFGDPATLSDIYATAPNPAQAGHYASVVMEQSRRRQLVRSCWDTAQAVLDNGAPEESDFKTIVEGLEGQLMRLLRLTQHSRKGQRSALDVTISVVEKLKLRYSQRGQPLGLTLGFPDLDRVMNGLQPGDFCTVAARPAMGKTSLATAFAEAIAADACNRRNRPVMLFTLEMSDEDIQERSLMGRARTAISKARTGMFSDAEGSVVRVAPRVLRETQGKGPEQVRDALILATLDELEGYWRRKEERGTFTLTREKQQQANDQIQSLCSALAITSSSLITFYDGYGVTTAEVRQEIRRWLKRIDWHPGDDLCPPLVIIDYIQLIKPSEKKAKGEPRLAIMEACEVLKGIAKEFGIAIMPLAQVGRGSEENARKMPGLKDLKESGAIEEYSDYVIFIHRPCYYTKWDYLKDDDKEKWQELADGRNRSSVREKLKEDAWTAQTYYEAHALLSIGKGRHCATADVDILFRGDLMRFSTKTPAMFSTNKEHRQESSVIAADDEGPADSLFD